MIELPEAYTLANQLGQAFLGKTIVNATANTSPHGFAWYSGDPGCMGEQRRYAATSPVCQKL